MKRHLSLVSSALAVIALALVFAALPLTTHAQSAVPGYITYQGKVSDAAGTLIGTGTPVNRKVRFRLYNDATSVLAANRLHSEEQTVTIANGEFNVLLGLGTAVSGETFVASLDTVFTGAARYLGVTVDGGSGTFASDPEISPRQQIVTMPYAFRAKLAEGVVGQSVTAAMIADSTITATQLANNTITSSKITDLSIVSNDLADSSVTTAKILDGTIGTADIGNGQVTAAKLGSDVGLWTTTSGNVYRTTGFVGVGTTTPTVGISAGGTLGNSKIAVWDDGTGGRMGFGVQGNQLRLHINSSSDRFSFLSSEAGTEVMTLLGTGRLGLGIANPGAKLSLASDLANTKLALYDDGAGGMYGFGIQASQFRLHLPSSAGRFSFLNAAAGTEVMTVTGGGAVGVGTAAPSAPLHVHTAGSDSRVLITNTNTGAANNDGVAVGTQNEGAFVWNHEASPLRFGTSSAERMRIEADGRMGFNATNGASDVGYIFSTPGYYMMVLHNSTGWRYAFNSDGTAMKWGGSSSWAIQSDARLKKNIAPLDGSLERLLKLRSVTFDWKDESIGKGQQTGFIAQEVQQVFPDWVGTTKSGTLSLEHKGFESHTVQALRELRAEKDAQLAQRDATIAALEQRVRDLETQTTTRLAAIERRLNAAALSANSPR